ncbi:hypothetical protein ACFL6S_33365 [Candidatus Poribacteria bacterium]
MKRLAMTTVLAVSVVLCLGVLSAYGQEGQTSPPQDRQRPNAQAQQNMPRMVIRMLDLNNDGQISVKEYMKFFIDADQDDSGSVSRQEMMDQMGKRRQEMGRERPQEARKGPQRTPGPDVGQDAPDFTLKTLDGKRTVKLSDFKGEERVVLVFGSYT